MSIVDEANASGEEESNSLGDLGLNELMLLGAKNPIVFYNLDCAFAVVNVPLGFKL